MVGNVQAPWDVHPSPTLCGLCLKVLRGRSGDADKKPLPTLTKDVYRPSGRASGTCGYPQRRYFESFCFEHARQAADAVFACKGEVGFVFVRRSSGYFDIRTLSGRNISVDISYKKLTLLKKRKTFLTEFRKEVRDSSRV